MLFPLPSKKINDPIRIRLGWKTITQLNHVKYLGILIDSTLNWKPHVSELSKKLARNCRIFYKIRHFVKAETLKLLYNSLFHSFLSYGITARGLTHPPITNPLYKLQKKIIHAICFEDKYDHTTPLFHRLKTLKLYDIHSLKLLCFVYDFTKDQSITYFNNFFTLVHSVHQHFTRQASTGNLFSHIVNTTQYGIRSAKYIGTILWNNLPMYIKDSSSKVIFKNELHKMFIDS